MVTKKEVEKEFDPMEGLEEVKVPWVKWGEVGDWFRGTLTDVREIDDNFNPGEKAKIYEVMISAGSFHYFEKVNGVTEVDKEPTILEAGSIWNVGGKRNIDGQMRNVKIGQTFGIRFSELKPNKNKSFNDAKILKVLVGEMDSNYSGETAADGA